MVEFITAETSDDILFQGVRTVGKKNDVVIVDVHGLSWDFYTTDFYRYFFKHINEQGIDFIAGDTRGANKIRSFYKKDGSEYQKGGAFENFEDCLIDIKAWIDTAQQLGYKKIFLSGYSFGPTKAAYYYHKTKDQRIDGLIFFSPSDIYGLTHEPHELPRFKKLLDEAHEMVRMNQGKHLLSDSVWGVEIFTAQTFISLFDNRDTAIFNYFDPRLGFEVLNSITVPVLSITGTKDDGILSCVTMDEAVTTLEMSLKNAPIKKVVVLEGCDHAFAGFEEKVFQETVNFIQKLSP